MLAPLDTLNHLKARLREMAGDIETARRDGFLSLVLELPEIGTVPPRLAGPQFCFLHAHRDEMRAGYGVAGEWRAGGRERLCKLRSRARGLAATWRHLDPDETGFTGFAMLGFAARPSAAGSPPPGGLPNALLWLPEMALCSGRGQAAIVLTAGHGATGGRRLVDRWTSLLDCFVPRLFLPSPGPLHPAPLQRGVATPDAAGWQRLVGAASQQIRSGVIEKVVVARRLSVAGSRRFDLSRLQGALSFLFPSCQIIEIRRDAASFVAATPERLVSLKGNRVEVDALAGTTSRAAESGRDGALGRALRRSHKNQHEHRLVVEAISEALGRLGSRIEAKERPEVMQLNNVQHLWTRIGTTLDGPSDVFTLADLLHPTPATNGHPRRAAGRWLKRADPFERGWYTGAAGIVGPDLSGELWVLLRCARISARTADLFAGAGIVAGSDAGAEWRETEHKLGAMLTALQFA
jgi:menaquinone-specific isochorismate synthase